MACNSGGTINIGDCLQFQNSTATQTYPSISTIFKNVLPNIYILSGLVIFFLIFFGGFTIIANSGNPDKQNEGKQIITSALIGFLIVFTSYFIIQIVQILTGIQILNTKL